MLSRLAYMEHKCSIFLTLLKSELFPFFSSQLHVQQTKDATGQNTLFHFFNLYIPYISRHVYQSTSIS